MGFDEGNVIFDHQNLTYNAGETVNGTVVFNQEKEKTFRGMYAKIKGYCDVRWKTRRGKHKVTHTSHETYFDQRVYLIGGPSGEVTLNPGPYEFPFQFTIPPNVPSSFEGSYGNVRYHVKVVVDRAFKFDQEKKIHIQVINLKDLNLDPRCKEVMEFNFEETYCCWCMNQGDCETTVKLPQSGYCPGQTINFECSCANNSSVEMNSICFEIIEHRQFMATSGFLGSTRTRSEKQVLASLRIGPVAGNTTRNWTLEKEIPQMDLHNLDDCKYIDIYHQFKVTVSPSGCTHPDTDGKRLIILGHIPLREFDRPSMQGDQVVTQDGFVGDGPAVPLLPNPYPPNAPVVMPMFVASAPPGTPDFDKNTSPFNPEFENK